MYCNRCGSKIPNHAKYCNFCGSTLDDSSQKNTTNSIMLILMAFAIFVFVLFGIINITRREEETRISSTPAVGENIITSIGRNPPNLPVPTQAPAPTQPPATQPPATQPPATQPPATQPPATQPPATQPPATEPQPPTTGWYVKNGVRYYYLNGVMMTGLQEIHGALYYFYEDGALAVNTNVKYQGNTLEAGNDGRILAITYAKIDGYWSKNPYEFKDGHKVYILELKTPVTNCDRAGVYIKASGLRGASVTSDWLIYVRSRGNWLLLNEVYYTEPSRSFSFTFNSPVEFDAICAYPTARGSYTYNVDYYMVDVHMLQ